VFAAYDGLNGICRIRSKAIRRCMAEFPISNLLLDYRTSVAEKKVLFKPTA
jgi:hypothetical protein